MKRIIYSSIIVVLIMVIGVFSSYLISKEHAKAIAKNSHLPLTPMKGHLILFIDGEFNPCWVFVSEHQTTLTGGTFDVYVSLFGNVIDIPGKKDKGDHGSGQKRRDSNSR